MITDPVCTDDIRYNATSGCFEAKVTLHVTGSTWVYGCEVKADLSLDYTDAETALRAEAQRRHIANRGLRSTRQGDAPHQLRSAKRRAAETTGLLTQFRNFGGRRAA
ncbi:MAG: hypothetical protein WBB25_20920 [Sulfitobacter sp.]